MISFDGSAHCLTLDGKVIWRRYFSGALNTKPLVFNGILYFGSRNQNYYALDARTGKEIWAFRTSYAAGDTGVVGDGVYYFGTVDKLVYAVDALTGKEIWRFPTKAIMVNIPLLLDDSVCIGTWDGSFYCLALDGSLKWKFSTSLGYESEFDFDPEVRDTITSQVTWKSSGTEDSEEEKKEESKDLSEYGEGIKSDYTGGISKDYVKGKKGYI